MASNINKETLTRKKIDNCDESLVKYLVSELMRQTQNVFLPRCIYDSSTEEFYDLQTQ